MAVDDQTLQQKIETLLQENNALKQDLDAKNKEISQNLRLVSAGESVAMIVHEALNPLTSVISKVQHLLDDDNDFQLIRFILSEWMKEVEEGGYEQLLSSLNEMTEDDITVLEEDLHNLVHGIDDTNKYLDFIHTQLKRVVLILNNLRELSRAESNVAATDVKHSIYMVVELMQESLDKRKIKMSCEFTHKSLIQIDENEFVQVLHNVARNAMQVIQKNGSISFHTSETPERIEVRIQDTGAGVPLDVADKIFDSRFTTKNKREGTGLGLTYSKRIMNKYNGDLILESPGGDGKGAVFLCWVPVTKNR